MKKRELPIKLEKLVADSEANKDKRKAKKVENQVERQAERQPEKEADRLLHRQGVYGKLGKKYPFNKPVTPDFLKLFELIPAALQIPNMKELFSSVDGSELKKIYVAASLEKGLNKNSLEEKDVFEQAKFLIAATHILNIKLNEKLLKGVIDSINKLDKKIYKLNIAEEKKKKLKI